MLILHFGFPASLHAAVQTPWPSSLYFTDHQLSLGQSHRSFFCCKSTFLCKSKEENPSTIKKLGLPTPQCYSIGWSFCASWHLTGVHVFSSAIYVNESVPWQRASAASTGEAQVKCVDKSISLLCSSPVEATHTADLYFCQGLRFSIIYFL